MVAKGWPGATSRTPDRPSAASMCSAGDRVPERRVAVRDDRPGHEGETRRALDVGRLGDDGLVAPEAVGRAWRAGSRTPRTAGTAGRRRSGASRTTVAAGSWPACTPATSLATRTTGHTESHSRPRPTRPWLGSGRTQAEGAPPNQVGALLGIALERLQHGPRGYAAVPIPAMPHVLARDGAGRHGRRPRDDRRGRTRTRRRSLRPPSSPGARRRQGRPLPGRRATDDAAPPRDDSEAPTAGWKSGRMTRRSASAPRRWRRGVSTTGRRRPRSRDGNPKRTRAREGAPAPASPGHGQGRSRRRSRRGGGRAGHGPTRPWPALRLARHGP